MRTATLLSAFAWRSATRSAAVVSGLLSICAVPGPGYCITIRVPEDRPSIQAAIDTPGADIVDCAQGRYREQLVIRNKSVTIAKRAGAAFCAVYYLDNSGASIPLVSISGPGSVAFDGIELVGGDYAGRGDAYNGMSPLGVYSTDADLTLRGVTVRRMYNFMVTAVGGSFTATDLTLRASDSYVSQCDIGLRLNGCRTVSIDKLTQAGGDIDHTIDINNTITGLPVAFTSAWITNCDIRASELDWGDCIRVCQDSTVSIERCRLYRLPGGEPATMSYLHTGVDILKNGNEVSVRKTKFEGLPLGIYCAGEFFPVRNSNNRIAVAQNEFTGCEFAAVGLNGVQDEIIDLGGGPFRSCGNNLFRDSVGYDVMLRNSPASIHACGNTWSDNNLDDVILDRFDDLRLGEVVTQCECLPCPDKMPRFKVPMMRPIWLPDIWQDEVKPPRNIPRPPPPASPSTIAPYVDTAGIVVRVR